MKELTEEQAIALVQTEWWKNATDHDIATFQLHTRRLCMPFSEFHRALESALGRPVWTHELGLAHESIKEELDGDKPPPTIEEIMNLIPENKRVIIAIRTTPNED